MYHWDKTSYTAPWWQDAVHVTYFRTWAKLKTHILIIPNHPRHRLSLSRTDFFIYMLLLFLHWQQEAIVALELVIHHVHVLILRLQGPRRVRYTLLTPLKRTFSCTVVKFRSVSRHFGAGRPVSQPAHCCCCCCSEGSRAQRRVAVCQRMMPAALSLLQYGCQLRWIELTVQSLCLKYW